MRVGVCGRPVSVSLPAARANRALWLNHFAQRRVLGEAASSAAKTLTQWRDVTCDPPLVQIRRERG